MTTTYQASQPVQINTAHDTICLTFVRHDGTILLLGTQEKHEHGATKSAHLFSGMDATSEGQEGITKAVSLRCEEKQESSKRDAVALCRCSSRSGNNERARGTSETQQVGDSPKNDFGPSENGKLIDGP
jgi:hypothetical protein